MNAYHEPARRQTQHGGNLLSRSMSTVTGTPYIDGPTAVADAIINRNYTLAISLINDQFPTLKLDTVHHDGDNIFHLMANYGQRDLTGVYSELVKLVFSRMSSAQALKLLNSRNRTTGKSSSVVGDTPLHLAARNRYGQLGMVYIDYGADPSLMAADGTSVTLKSDTGAMVRGSDVGTYVRRTRGAPQAASTASAPHNIDLNALADAIRGSAPRAHNDVDTISLIDTDAPGSSAKPRSSVFPLTSAPLTGQRPIDVSTPLGAPAVPSGDAQHGGAASSSSHRRHGAAAPHSHGRGTVAAKTDTEDHVRRIVADPRKQGYLASVHNKYFKQHGGDDDSQNDDDDDGVESAHGVRELHNTLSSVEGPSDMDTDSDIGDSETSFDYTDEDHAYPLRRNYSQQDTDKHLQAFNDISKILNKEYQPISRDDSDDEKKRKYENNLPIASVKAALWKKAKLLISEDVQKSGVKPPRSELNTAQTDKLLSLITKKYINSIKDEIAMVEEDMRKKGFVPRGSDSSVDLASDRSSDDGGKRSQGRQRSNKTKSRASEKSAGSDLSSTGDNDRVPSKQRKSNRRNTADVETSASDM